MATPHPRTFGKIVDGHPEVVISWPAEQILEMRGISEADIMRALSSGVSRKQETSGNEVFRAGDLFVVAKREDDRIVIISAIHADDFRPYPA